MQDEKRVEEEEEVAVVEIVEQLSQSMLVKRLYIISSFLYKIISTTPEVITP